MLPESPRTAEYIKQALARVGIDVELRNIDLGSFIRAGLQLQLRADPELHVLLPDPTLGVQRLYMSGNIKKGMPFANAAGYENKEVDEAFDGRADRERSRPSARRCSPSSSA